MENILVTGAAGFIGTNLVAELIKQRHKVYALIENGDSMSRGRLYAINSNIEIIDDWQYMLRNANSYPAFDRIFHLATVGVRPDFHDIELICDVNIKLGCQLVDFAKENRSGVLVNFGSCFEYGDHGDVRLTEDMDCHPESLYAISKNASTNLVTGYAKTQDVKMITVRPFGVFGEGEGPTRLVPSIISGCLKGEKVKTTSGEQIRDFVNVKDIVKAIICLSESKYKPYEIYNICSDNPVSVRDFILEIVNVCGFDISLVDFGSIPYRKNEAMTFSGDNKKLQSVIHYPFPSNHKDGILDIYNTLKTKD
ncbi:NAD-dependent epimerase/dehydratase family protein [uncultured Bacteroides sp.]|uniref:NAD-dependent epimerase/dehydratase family protein n=1 Tax=uncultured Bacteroides sp. TaxID=162156 RepID=UPI002620EE89|nr:NAD-dependent epimerase/dehydratase family protein [uncultured Bacteroides sp.]